jgi:RNA polymerase sigma-70 factor (ECF subfamily)
LTAKETLLTETEKLTRLSQGDAAVFREVIEEYFPILCRFAQQYLPDASLAEDVVQEVFIKLWTARINFDNYKALKGYIFTSTRNGCLNLSRGRDRQEHRLQDAFGQDPGITDSVLTEIVHMENLALIYQAVRTLPPKMREVFILSYREGMTVKQISLHLNMKVKAVKNLKYRTLVNLRSKFRDNHASLLLLALF